MSQSESLTRENFLHTALRFRDRQAGVSVIFDPKTQQYTYNAYCIETKLVEELFTCEYDDLDDAVALIQSEFGTWESFDLNEKKSGCSSCVAKH